MSDELLEQFLVEGRELAQQAGEDLLALERRPGDAAVIDSAFRAFHTLKGSAGLFDFAPMTEMLHAGEDLLGAVRAGARPVDAPLTEALLAAVSQTEAWLDAIAAAGALPAGAAAAGQALAARLRGALAAAAPEAARPATAAWAEAVDLTGLDGGGPFTLVRYLPRRDAYFAGDDPLAVVRAVPRLLRLDLAPREAWGPLADYDPFACNLAITAVSAAPAAEVRPVFRFVADQVEIAERSAAPASHPPSAVPQAAAPEPAAARTLRVESERIDELAAAVDELVVAKNALAHLSARIAAVADNAPLARSLAAAQAEVDRLTGRLHASVTRLRLLPLRPLFRRLPRLAREMAGQLGKDAELIVRGEDVEVDKTVVDGLFEPLLHLLRNALDHGAETPQARRAAGKPPRAALTLSARAAGDQVVIEVSDDGRGIDPEAVRAAAVRRGVLDAEAAAALSDEQAIELIFAAGFSTAAEVSELSGRGVGMDAVRNAVARLGGRVGVRSRPGAGTTVSLRLPASVVLTRVMMVEAGGESFGVPLEDVVETARIPAGRLVQVRAGRAVVLRDRALPVLTLGELLGQGQGAQAADLNLLVVRAGEELVGVAVERFGERLETPLRPMSGLLSGLSGVVGTALLGDGRVLMVLDLPELVG